MCNSKHVPINLYETPQKIINDTRLCKRFVLCAHIAMVMGVMSRVEDLGSWGALLRPPKLSRVARAPRAPRVPQVSLALPLLWWTAPPPCWALSRHFMSNFDWQSWGHWRIGWLAWLLKHYSDMVVDFQTACSFLKRYLTVLGSFLDSMA